MAITLIQVPQLHSWCHYLIFHKVSNWHIGTTRQQIRMCWHRWLCSQLVDSCRLPKCCGKWVTSILIITLLLVIIWIFLSWTRRSVVMSRRIIWMFRRFLEVFQVGGCWKADPFFIRLRRYNCFWLIPLANHPSWALNYKPTIAPMPTPTESPLLPKSTSASTTTKPSSPSAKTYSPFSSKYSMTSPTSSK